MWETVSPNNWTDELQFVSDYMSLIDAFATISTHLKFWLCLPPPAFSDSFDISGPVIHDRVAPALQSIAAQRSLNLIDCHTPLLARSEFFDDGVHPNKDGAAYIARIVYDAIANN